MNRSVAQDNSPVIRWTVPFEARRAAFRRDIAKSLKYSAISIGTGLAVLVLFAGIMNPGRHCQPGRLIPLLVFYPVGYLLAAVYQSLIGGRQVVLSKRGVCRAGVCSNWKNMESWRISHAVEPRDFPKVEILRTMSRRSQWRSFVFNPSDVSEIDIRAVLEHYMPGKERSVLEIDN